MRRILTFGLAVSVLVSLSSCGGGDDLLVGRWVKPVEGLDMAEKERMMEGFELHKDGTAESVNMATLCYEKWEKVGENLVLSGKSIGNRIEFAFSDTLGILENSAESLVLSKGNLTLCYERVRKAE